MKLIQYNPLNGFDEILHDNGLKLPDHGNRYIFPDIPVIRQIENRYAEYGIWSDTLFTFAKLSGVANISSGFMLKHVSKLGRLMIMEEVLGELEEELSILGEYSGVKGFSDSLLGLLAEIKHMAMTHEDLKSLSGEVIPDTLSRKLKDLSLIFDAYQRKLSARGMADDIDLLHHLSSIIRSGGFEEFISGTERIIVFGFYDFTRAQVNVLESLETKVDDVIVLVPGYGDLKKLENSVQEMLKVGGSTLNSGKGFEDQNTDREVMINTYPVINYEFDGVFREIKRLVTEEGYSCDDIAVVFRSVGGFSSRLINTADKYGVPVRMDDSLNLRTSLYGQFLNDLVALPASNYRRDEFLRLLKNPVIRLYIGGKRVDKDISVIEEASASRYKTYQGLKKWKSLLEKLGEDPGYGLSNNTIQKLTVLLDQISSGSGKPLLSSLTDSICRILDLIDINKLNQELIPLGYITDNCWSAFSSFINELGFVSDAFDRRFSDPGDYLSFLDELMQEKSYSYSTETDSSHVQVLGGLKIRGVSYPVVFIVNVDENSFPAPYVKDPLLKIHERRQINSSSSGELFAEDEIHYEKEEQIFRLMCSAATEKLYISYSRLDDDYLARNSSHLIDTIDKPVVNEYGFTDFLTDERFFSVSDMLSSYFYNTNAGHPDSTIQSALKEYTDSEPLGYIKSGIDAEISRYRLSGKYSGFEGVLPGSGIIKKEYFRPTELEQYGTCPFMYFSRYILGLREERPIEDEIEPIDLGNLCHEVLGELFGSRLRDYITFDNLPALTPDRALEEYRELIKDDKYEVYFSHLSDNVREMEKKRVLEFVLPSFIEAETERIREKGFIPFMFEESVDFSTDTYSIAGKIDRADRDLNGNVIVYDYKSGSVGSKKYYDYRNLQLPLYLTALGQKGYKPYEGYYLSVRSRDLTGREGEGKLKLDDAVSFISGYTEAIEKGFFPPLIEKKEDDFTVAETSLEYDFSRFGTCRFCGYSDICRVKNGVKREGSGNK